MRLAAAAHLSLVLAAPFVAPAFLQAQQPMVAPRLSGPVVVDGRVDEQAWMDIEPLPAIASSPAFGGPPSERTEFRLAHDGEYLYVSGRMYDRDPGGIRATSLRRDDGALTNDWFAINLDTFLDRENMLVMALTPAGVRTDAVFGGDGTLSPNFSWNTYWDGRVSTDSLGWQAEIRIPLSSLRFEVVDGRLIMGVIIWRRIARRNEVISWPGIEHLWGTNSVFKATRATEVAFDGVERANPAYATAYALAGPSRRNALDGAGTAYVSDDSWARELGLDVKLSPAPNLAVDLSINTDFAQVEADDQQINLTRFSLFFPERRLFFQERASLFDYAMGGTDRLFYSRRIGLVDGQPVRIYGGGRVTGRLGSWDVGVLDMQTASSGETGSENSGVFRARRRVLNANSYGGGILTSRIEDGGKRSFAGGGDALLSLGGQNYLWLALAGTSSSADTLSAADRSFAMLRLERRGLYGPLFDVEVARVGQGLDPALGFLARRGHDRTVGTLGYGLAMGESSPLLHMLWRVGFQAYRRHDDGALESGQIAPEWVAETRSGHVLTATAFVRHEDLLRSFTLAKGVTVPAGEHDYATVRLAYAPASTSLIRVSGNVESGSFYDGRLSSASLSPTWNASRHLQLVGTYQVNRLDFGVRDQELTTHIARVRLQYMLNSQISSVSLVQFNSAADAVLLNFRLRYNPREGNDLYIVFNQGLNSERASYDPVRPLTESRSLLIKYSHTARLLF